MEKAALELLQQTANIPTVLEAADQATSKAPQVVLPEGFQLVNLEAAMPHRQHYRCAFSTDSVTDYLNYVELFDVEGSKCFIDSTQMSAKTIFDMGSVELPGHQKHTAKLGLTPTAAYVSMLERNGRKLNQKSLSDWIEDWSDSITAVGVDGNAMTAMQAASAVRKITIEASRTMESEIGDFDAHMSAMERIEATSSMIMPATIKFTCKPYNDLIERTFTLRVGILTGEDKPVLVMRVLQLESIQEEITEEFKALIVEGLKTKGCVTETFIGNV